MTNPIDILNAHACYLSDTNEDDILQHAASLMAMNPDEDVANFAIRTCTCGARIDGFDEYHIHLKEQMEAAIK